MKNCKWLPIILCLAAAVLLSAGCSGSGEQPFESLTAGDIESASVTLIPPQREILLEQGDFEELASLLNGIVIYEEDDAGRDTEGQLVEFQLSLTDGSHRTVGAYGSYVYVDGACYRAQLEPSNALGSFGNRKAEETDVPVWEGIVARHFGDSILLAGDDEEGEKLVSLYLGELEVAGASFEELAPGMHVRVEYGGQMKESYPAQLVGATRLTVTQTEPDVAGACLELLAEIYAEDPALNSDTTLLAVDLSEASILSAGEKSAVLYLAGVDFGMEVLEGTWQELADEGYIDEENLYFPDGVLITLAVTEGDREGFRFTLDKWRSGLGAVGCSGEAGFDGQWWNYTIGEHWIS